MSSIIILLITVTFLLSIFLLIVWVGKKYNGADWGHPATNVLDGWIRIYCQNFHRQGKFSIELPDEKKLLLISNHICAIDPLFLVAAINRPIRFMIAKEEYERPILNRIFKSVGCIPVDRGGRVEGAFRSAMRAIEAGELVAVFPQGGIHSLDNPRERIKPGIIKLSELTGCSILPVRINGVSAPGTMVKCVFKRSNIRFDVVETLPTEQVQTDWFRPNISQWLIGQTDYIRPKPLSSDH